MSNSPGNRSARTVALVLASGLAWPAAVFAEIEEIVVTAQKRSESIQDVATAMSAISGETMRENNVVAGRDLFLRVPNVSLASNSTAGQLQLSIRGVNFLSFSPISVQPILMFVDEVVVNSPQTSGLFLFDLDRVEVLRGPQNTLYGRNTTGGAVNLVTRKPEIGAETNGYIDATYGRFDTMNVEAAVGGSLGERSAYRVAVQSLHNDGYWENVTTGDRMGERDQTIGRAQLLFEPNEALAVRFDVHGGASNGGQRAVKGHGLFDDAVALNPCSSIDVDDLESPCVDYFGHPTLSENDEIQSELSRDRDDIKLYGGSVTLDWKRDDFNLLSITAYEGNEYDHWEDADPIPISFVLFRQYAETEQLSQEFRAVSADDTAFRWIVGAFGMWENTEFSTAVPIALFDPAAAFSDNNLVDHDTEVYSAYGQVEFDVSDRVTLSAGLRYAREDKSGTAQYQFVVGLDALDVNDADAFLFENLVPFRVPDTYIKADFGDAWDLWGGKLGIEYKPSDEHLLYANLSRGAKAGQFTDAPDAIANGGFFLPAEPETVVSFEVGAKSEWLGRELVTNFAAFFNDYKDQQQQITYPNGQGSVVSTVVNVASSRTYGIEFDGQWDPGNGWYADAAIGWLHTETREDSLGDLTGGAISVREGRELTNAPEWIISASVAKEWMLDNGNALRIGVDGRYTSERNYDLVETAADPVWVTDPSYILLNAVASLSFGDDQRYRLSLWGKNLTNELYFLNMQEFGIGTSILFASDPSTYGVTLGVEF